MEPFACASDGDESSLLLPRYDRGFTLEESTPSLRWEQGAMSKVSVYVGLDYHKDSIQVCVMDRAGKILANRRCTNQVEALVRLGATFSDDVHAAVGSC